MPPFLESSDASNSSMDDSKGPVLLALTCTLFSFSILTTCLRVWVRFRTGHLGSDDYTISVVAILAIARTAIQIVSVKHGNGEHRQYLSSSEYIFVNELTWFTQILLFVTICLLKTSIGLLLLRLKDTKAIKITIYVMITGLALTNLLPLIVLLAECNPLSQYWDPKPTGSCWPSKIRIYSIYVQAGYSVVTDFLCSLMPILFVWKIQLRWRRKIAVCGLMSLGLIATACAIVRASSLGTATTDLSYDYAIAAIWANTELHLGIIAANLAMSHAIVLYFFGDRSNLLPSRSGNSRSRDGSTPSRSLHAHAYGDRSRKGYIRSREVGSTTITAGGFDPLQDANDKEFEMGQGIHKTTEVLVTGHSARSIDSDEQPGTDDRSGSHEAVFHLPIQKE